MEAGFEKSYQAAHDKAVWVDLGSMGRLITSDRDRLDLIHRLSTNHMTKLNEGEGCATILTTPIARVIDQVTVLNRGETALVVTGLGRGEAVEGLLLRNVFWNDRFQIENVSKTLGQIGIFGKESDAIVEERWAGAMNLAPNHFIVGDDGSVVVRTSGLACGNGYWVMADLDTLAKIKDELSENGVNEASLAVYDALRIEAGLPEVGHELTEDFIPLELGLWDTVSFNKGCYVGQEVIARMESRGKLAKMLVRVVLEDSVLAGTGLVDENGKSVGTVTSVAEIPEDEGMSVIIGLAVVKTDVAMAGTTLLVKEENGVGVEVIEVAGNYEAVFD